MAFNFLLILFCVTFCSGQIPQPLPDDLDIDPNFVSVSGLSAGAAMASQVHVAFSSSIMGCALFAGPPYYCAQDSLTFALGRCMATPGNIPVDTLISETEAFAQTNDIDDPSNIAGDKVFVWSGAYDDVVLNGVMVASTQYYEFFGAQVLDVCPTEVPAGHGQPVVDYPGGNDCASSSSPYVNNCGYDGAYEALNWIYGNLTRPQRTGPTKKLAEGELILFDQTDFLFNPGSISMDTAGYVYVPPQCEGGQTRCKLHIAFHGCLMGRDQIDDAYAAGAGYNEVGDANSIVILYPHAVRSLGVPYNPNGCFDWWGYNDGLASEYATKNGPQVVMVRDMVNTLLGLNK